MKLAADIEIRPEHLSYMRSVIIGNRFIETYEWEIFPIVRFRSGTNSISWNVMPETFCDIIEKVLRVII